MTVYHQDHDVTLHQGHVLDVLPTLPAESVNCIVTSPPYYGLRDYGVDGQLGLEKTPAEYVAALVDVFRQLRRVLRADGVAWLNIGDSYSATRANGGGYSAKSGLAGFTSHDTKGRRMNATGGNPLSPDVPPKNLLGVPWRVAFALQDDGWILRNAAIWNKPNAMPESVTDRLSNRYEHVFLLTRSRRYWFNLDPIREALARPEALTEGLVFGGTNKADALTTGSSTRRTGSTYGKAARPPGTVTHSFHSGTRHDEGNPRGRNPGDVWSIPTSPFPGAHFATMPPELARRCILAGCPDDGVVLDPFAGSGTTPMVARQLGRKAVGVELNPDYLALQVQRIGQAPFDFGEATA